LIQLTSPSAQTSSPVFYAAYLDNFGRLTFGVLNYGLDYVIQSQLPYSDGNIHVAMVTIGNAGMKMYVDGKIVAHRTVQLANYTAGNWFFGGMNPSGWPYSPSSPYFQGTLYCMGWWNGTQLSDSVSESATQATPSPIPNNYCAFTGNIASLAQPPGYAYANQTVTLQTFQTQGPQCGGTSPIAPSYQSYTTDSSGNLPSGIFIQQGAHVQMSIGYGAPIPLVAPCASTCPLANFFPTPTATVSATPTATTATSTATATPTVSATPTPIPNQCIFGSQQVEFNISTCNSTGTSPPLNVRAGDSLYVAAGNNGTGASQVTFITDSQGDTWNANDMLNAQGTTQSAAIGSAFNVTGGPTTVSVQIAGGTVCNTNVYVIETPPTNALDVTAHNQSAAASPFDSGTTGITASPSEFVLAVVGQNGSGLSSGPTNGFSELFDPINNQSFAACILTNTQGQQNTQWTPSNFAGQYAAGIAAYKLAPTATPTGATATPTATATPGMAQFVQQGTNHGSGGTSMVVSFPANAQVGDTVVVYVGSSSTGTIDTLSLSGFGISGGSWHELGGINNISSQQFIYAGVVASTGQSVTISGLANLSYNAVIAEFTATPNSITQDGGPAFGVGSNGNTVHPNPAYGTTNPRDIIVCGANSNNALSSQPSAPFINLTSLPLSNQDAYQIVTSTGLFQPSWGNGTANWAAMCAGIQY